VSPRPAAVRFKANWPVASATGKFALKRTAAGGGDTSGRFTLILRQTSSGWKIIHDHTSS